MRNQRQPHSGSSLDTAKFRFHGLRSTPLAELCSLLLFYTLICAAFYYVVGIIARYVFLASDRALFQFRGEQQVLFQGLAIFSALALTLVLFRHPLSRVGLHSMGLLQFKNNPGLPFSRFGSALLDGLLKGFLCASFFVGTLSILGIVDFEVAAFFDWRGLFAMLPLFLEQFLSLVIWLLALEFLRRYLYHLLVLRSSHEFFGILMLLGFETYLLFQVFWVGGLDIVRQFLTVLACALLATSQLIAYRQSFSHKPKNQVRVSVFRFALSVGFWASLVFAYGASLGNFRASSYVNLLAGTSWLGWAADLLKPDNPVFLALTTWFFVGAANLVLRGSVRSPKSLARSPSRQSGISDESVSTLSTEDFEFQS